MILAYSPLKLSPFPFQNHLKPNKKPPYTLPPYLSDHNAKKILTNFTPDFDAAVRKGQRACFPFFLLLIFDRYE